MKCRIYSHLAETLNDTEAIERLAGHIRAT